jgi:hypothetical protein
MVCHARRLVVLLIPLLLVACGPSGQQRTAQLLDQRLQFQLAHDIAGGTAVLQPLSDGARVTFLTTSSFANDNNAMTGEYPDIRANVIEALLDPNLMQIAVADTTGLPEVQRNQRVQNVSQYFVANGLGSTLQPVVPMPAAVPDLIAAGPAGLTITISVRCPVPHDGAGYDTGQSKPMCN